MTIVGKPIKGLGNYASVEPRVERRPATVIKYQGPRAHIRFHDGTTYAMPAEPLLQAKVPEGGVFFVVTRWVGRNPIESHIEVPAEARPALDKRQTPKIMVKTGRKMITRQKLG